MHDVVKRARRLLPEVVNARGEVLVRSRQMPERRLELRTLTQALREELSRLRRLRHQVAQWRRDRTSPSRFTMRPD